MEPGDLNFGIGPDVSLFSLCDVSDDHNEQRYKR